MFKDQLYVVSCVRKAVYNEMTGGTRDMRPSLILSVMVSQLSSSPLQCRLQSNEVVSCQCARPEREQLHTFSVSQSDLQSRYSHSLMSSGRPSLISPSVKSSSTSVLASASISFHPPRGQHLTS